MSDSFFQALARFEYLIVFIPIFAAIFFISCIKFLHRKLENVSYWELVFFQFAGCLVGYLTFYSKGSLLKDFIPFLAAGLSFYVSLFVRARDEQGNVTGSKEAYLFGVLVIMSFIFSLNYFTGVPASS